MNILAKEKIIVAVKSDDTDVWQLEMFELEDSQKLMRPNGELVNVVDALKDKTIVIFYFSAAWCGPCKILLPILKKVYEESVKRQSGIEIIYVSSDSDKETYMSNFVERHGNWLAIPYEDALAEELRYRYHVTNIPNLVVIRQDGTIITSQGRAELEEIGINVLVTWTE